MVVSRYFSWSLDECMYGKFGQCIEVCILCVWVLYIILFDFYFMFYFVCLGVVDINGNIGFGMGEWMILREFWN